MQTTIIVIPAAKAISMPAPIENNADYYHRHHGSKNDLNACTNRK